MLGFDGMAPHWLWLAAGLLLATAELIAPGVFLIWLAGAALATGVAAALLPLPGWAQVLLFVELAIVAVLIARARLRRRGALVDPDPLLNVPGARLVGRTAVVTQAIVAREGRVRLGDSEWIARGDDAPVGTTLRVTGNEGSALLVEEVKPAAIPPP